MPPLSYRAGSDASFHGDPPFYVGYDENLHVAEVLAQATYNGPPEPVFCFAFGFPGTGKSTFSEALGYRLNQAKPPVSLLEVNCLEIADSSPADARRIFGELNDLLWNRAEYPMVLALDEIDSVAMERAQGPPPSQVTATYSTMNLPKQIRATRKACLVVAVTNDPEICDRTIKSEMEGAHIYFNKPTDTAVKQIIQSFDVQSPETVAEQYLRLCREGGTLPMVRPLVVALKNVNRLPIGSPATPEQMAQWLHTLGPGPDREDFERYEQDNQRRIAQARAFADLLRGRGA